MVMTVTVMMVLAVVVTQVPSSVCTKLAGNTSSGYFFSRHARSLIQLSKLIDLETRKESQGPSRGNYCKCRMKHYRKRT